MDNFKNIYFWKLIKNQNSNSVLKNQILLLKFLMKILTREKTNLASYSKIIY